MPKSFLLTDSPSGRLDTGIGFLFIEMFESMGNRMKWPILLLFCFIAILSNSAYCPAVVPKQLTIQPGPEDGYDSYISKGYEEENKNFGKKEDMAVGNRDSKRILLRFDLSSIPPGASISSAELQLCLEGEYCFCEQEVIYVHQVTRFWRDGEVTWNQAKEKRNWNSPGGDFDWTIESATSLIGKNSGWVSWDVTRTVKNWWEGKYINLGFLLKEHNCVSEPIWFLSSDFEWEAYRPRLVVSYEVEEAPPEPTSPPAAPSIKVYPNPFKPSAGHREIVFANLPSGAVVKIFHIE
ncbi:DNRLRE domain-containing protein, partial [bacterium]|nr:DNRLRE domain-containing protein [bacterium]